MIAYYDITLTDDMGNVGLLVLICTKHNSTPDRTRTGDYIYQGLPGSDWWWREENANPARHV